MVNATVTLRLSPSVREERLDAWALALGRVPAARRRIRIAEAPTALAARCVEAGIELVVAEEFAPSEVDIVVFASGDDLPTPHSLQRLVAAVGRDDPIMETRLLPYGAYARGPGDVPTPGPRVCVAVSGTAPQELLAAETIEDAVDAARRAGLVVQRADDAAVFRDRRPPGSPEPNPHDIADPPPYGHPGALPSTTLHQLLLRTGITPPELSKDREERPFLTVITRTQGTRLLLLEEVLTCLAGQSSRDFELIVACHRVDDAQLDAVRRLLATLPGWLQERTRVLEVVRPGRSSPLNDALEVASGRYAVVLDDDDAVTADWVAAFAELEVRAPGTVLRSAALRQDAEPTAVSPDHHGRDVAPRETGFAHPGWPREFNLVDHLWDNASPFMTVAFPCGVWDDLGLRFDETLEATEDWAYLLGATTLVGVTSTPALTSVYRTWTGREGSRDMHDEGVWAAARQSVLDGVDQQVLLLPPGAAREIRELHRGLREESTEKFRFAGLNEKAAQDLVAVNEAVVVLRARIADLEERLARQRRRRQPG